MDMLRIEGNFNFFNCKKKNLIFVILVGFDIRIFYYLFIRILYVIKIKMNRIKLFRYVLHYGLILVINLEYSYSIASILLFRCSCFLWNFFGIKGISVLMVSQGNFSTVR